MSSCTLSSAMLVREPPDTVAKGLVANPGLACAALGLVPTAAVDVSLTAPEPGCERFTVESGFNMVSVVVLATCCTTFDTPARLGAGANLETIYLCVNMGASCFIN